ncbi:MAG: ATP-binding protein [Brevundimonas sp.]
MALYASITPFLATSARERRGQVPVRILLGLLLAWALWSSGRPELILPWLALSAAVQVLEWMAMKPFRRLDGEALTQRRIMIPALASIVAMAITHAAVAALVWSHAGQVLSTVAVLILAGGILNNLASGIESRALFLLGGTPYLVALAAMPLVTWMRGDIRHLAILLVTIALFFLAALGVWSRVHAARRAEIAALAEAQLRLEQAERAMADRAAMAAVVSHELRTPLSAIMAGAHVIRHGEAADRTPETADLIIDAGGLMTGMLNDLLDHSKIEARAMTLEVRDFDLTAFVSDTVNFWRAPAADKGLTLIFTAPEAPVWLKGDPYRLRQILNNLVSNAIKFTAKGVVALEATTTETAAGRRLLRLVVRDQGAGIKPEAMERLFTPFSQGSAEVARTYGGTGLGLAVSRDLARLMGGELKAESTQGVGAVFVVEVEMSIGEPIEAVPKSQPTVDLPERIRVLAVDDHEINRRTLALVLQPLDVDLTLASDGHTALELLGRQTFDAILMDVNMPGIDGNETTRRLRASSGPNASVPVIGFSAGTEPAQVASCREAGMTDWLAKPLDPGKLYLALSHALSGNARSAV